MKRKFLIVLLSIVCALCLAFGLSACDSCSGNGGSTDGEQNNEQTGGNTDDGSGSSDEDGSSSSGSSSDDNTGSSSGDSGTSGGSSSGDTEQGGSTDGGTEEAATLEYTLSGGGDSYIVSGIGSVTSTTVTIPSTYNNKPVTAIADGAFKDNTIIVIIIIADSVTSIGENAFSGCTSLTNVTIGGGVTTIGASAFSGCSVLESINVPANVTSIGENAFKNCVKLVIIKIYGNPAIGDGAFGGCTLISDVTLSDELLAKLSELLNNVFSDSSTITDVKDSTGETYHNYEGYSYNENEHWQICTICGEKTTSESHTLNSDNICSVCGYEKLIDSVGLAYTLSDDKTYYTVSGIGTCNDTNLVIPSTYEGLPVTAIAESAFANQTQLKSVYVPDSVTLIGSAAFSGCSSLVSMTLPFVGGSANATTASISTLFGYIFGTSSYTGGTATKAGSYYELCFYIPTSLTTVTITGGNILFEAFFGCTSLESITIPDSVTSIDAYAFYYCTSLESITIPDSVTFIGASAFSGCTSLKSVTIPDSVTTIGSGAFFDCTSLTSITLPDSVTAFYNAAFNNTAYYNDTNNWENNVLYIGNYLIEAKTSISGSYTIKEGTTVIAYSAFDYCESLTSITIPDSITSIGYCTFYWCTSLESITIPDSVTSIGGYAFYNCASLESITIPDSVTSIGESAFSNCASLKSVTIGSGVTSIGDSAFYYCTSLTSIDIPDSVTSIGSSTFSRCTALESVTIGSGVTSIGYGVFFGCTALESVTIPDSVTSIGRYVFYNCTALTSVTFENTSGWYVTTTENTASGTDIASDELSVTSTAATYLTSTYFKYYWYRSEN